MTSSPLRLGLAMTCLGLLALPACAAEDKDPALLQGYDALALPGEDVRLAAKLEKMGALRFRPDIEDEEVIFSLNGQALGSNRTDDDGVAAVFYAFKKPGRYTVRAALPGTSEYRADPAPVLVDVCDPKTRFLVCDIDHTIADISSLEFIVTDNKDVPALPGSVEALRRLARHYHIIYVTARDDAFMKKTRNWMALRRFPRGPVFFWDFLGAKLSHRKYKTRRLAAVKKRFPNLVAGVGDKVGDAEAYLANGLRAIIIGRERDDDLPKKAVWVRSWAEVEKHLAPEK
jgi:hypothetical protein